MRYTPAVHGVKALSTLCVPHTQLSLHIFQGHSICSDYVPPIWNSCSLVSPSGALGLLSPLQSEKPKENTQEGEAGGLQVLGWPGPQSETLCQNTQKQTNV